MSHARRLLIASVAAWIGAAAVLLSMGPVLGSELAGPVVAAG